MRFGSRVRFACLHVCFGLDVHGALLELKGKLQFQSSEC